MPSSDNGPKLSSVGYITLHQSLRPHNKLCIPYLNIFLIYSYCFEYWFCLWQITEDHYQALVSFFTKYTNLTINDIYLAGDGYAGVYIPLLMKKTG